jgi:hypothetical protein
MVKAADQGKKKRIKQEVHTDSNILMALTLSSGRLRA